MPGVIAKEKLCELLAEFADDECSRELLQLLGKHPFTRLSHLTVMHALDWHKPEINRTLLSLLQKRLVKTRVENGITLYWLTEDEPVNSLIQSLATLNGRQWQRLLGTPSAMLPSRAGGHG